MAKGKIAVVDYGMGNIHSIIKALRLYNDDVTYTADPVELRAADALVLPGDGAFEAAMAHLQGGLEEIIRAHVLSGRPLLGVCIGFQILFEDSTERHAPNSASSAPPTPGLGLIPGRIRRFEFADRRIRVPHMGWNQLLDNRGAVASYAEEYMYFIHSYRAVDVPDENVLAWCEYGGERFPAIVQKENIQATQFHPEKSHRAGLKMLEEWVLGIGNRE